MICTKMKFGLLCGTGTLLAVEFLSVLFRCSCDPISRKGVFWGLGGTIPLRDSISNSAYRSSVNPTFRNLKCRGIRCSPLAYLKCGNSSFPRKKTNLPSLTVYFPNEEFDTLAILGNSGSHLVEQGTVVLIPITEDLYSSPNLGFPTKHIRLSEVHPGGASETRVILPALYGPAASLGEIGLSTPRKEASDSSPGGDGNLSQRQFGSASYVTPSIGEFEATLRHSLAAVSLSEKIVVPFTLEQMESAEINIFCRLFVATVAQLRETRLLSQKKKRKLEVRILAEQPLSSVQKAFISKRIRDLWDSIAGGDSLQELDISESVKAESVNLNESSFSTLDEFFEIEVKWSLPPPGGIISAEKHLSAENSPKPAEKERGKRNGISDSEVLKTLRTVLIEEAKRLKQEGTFSFVMHPPEVPLHKSVQSAQNSSDSLLPLPTTPNPELARLTQEYQRHQTLAMRLFKSFEEDVEEPEDLKKSPLKQAAGAAQQFLQLYDNAIAQSENLLESLDYQRLLASHRKWLLSKMLAVVRSKFEQELKFVEDYLAKNCKKALDELPLSTGDFSTVVEAIVQAYLGELDRIILTELLPVVVFDGGDIFKPNYDETGKHNYDAVAAIYRRTRSRFANRMVEKGIDFVDLHALKTGGETTSPPFAPFQKTKSFTGRILRAFATSVRKRKPVAVSFHYLSPSAFGLSDFQKEVSLIGGQAAEVSEYVLRHSAKKRGKVLKNRPPLDPSDSIIFPSPEIPSAATEIAEASTASPP